MIRRTPTPREAANRAQQKRTFVITPACAEAMAYTQGLKRAAIAESAETRHRRETAVVDGRSWWECDRAELSRRAAARFPTAGGSIPRPNF